MSSKLTNLNMLRLQQTYEKGQRLQEDLRARTRALFQVGHRYSFYIKNERAYVSGRCTGYCPDSPTGIRLAVEYLNKQSIPTAEVILHPAIATNIEILSYDGVSYAHQASNKLYLEPRQINIEFGRAEQRELEISSKEYS